MLKILGIIESLTRPGKGGVEVDDNSKARQDRNKLDGNKIGNNQVDDEVDNKVGKKGQNLSKSKTKKSGFLTSGARMTFTKLKQAFIKALILYHFDLKCHIWVETDSSGYAIDRALSQLILDNLGQ